ncbi:GMC family oxidoreductase N-terminal domain-containing protein [Paenibacillus sp. WST5]|uniref:GMC family oxidoreductase N-terminal domain-containing protein n=2 Tax=Paenibacillus sedimenti TaxID=2770274 RepID=A0A926QN65_9BACL|nr:GMC family oxidoreductase N-terminal domain-containing protein [Paenibacillus sedimenti]
MAPESAGPAPGSVQTVPESAELAPEAVPSVPTTAGLPTCPSDPVPPLYNWFPLTPLSEMADREYDVLIVGTGAGGGAALWRFCERWREQNLRIGIIDRGDLLLPTHARNLPMMTTERLTRYFVTVSRPLPGAGTDYPGARQLFTFGGRTLFWYAFAIRMNFALLPEWPVPLHEMESYYNIAEQEMNVTRAFTEDATFTEILLNRLWENGFSGAGHIPLAADLVPSVYGQIHTDVFTSSISFLSRALNIRPFDLAVNARAVEIKHEGGKVTGVQVMTPDRTAYTLKAKTVVLSASTFETPRLLLHSGIRNPALGHYLMNHTFVQATGIIGRAKFPFPLGTLGIMVPSNLQRPYLLLMAGPGNFYWYQPTEVRPFAVEESVLFFGYGQVSPRYENRITLNPFRKDAYGVPEVEVHFSFSPEEQRIIGQIAEGIRRVSEITGIRLTPLNERPTICLTPAGDLHHDSGTCRIGNDPLTSAADQYGEIRGVTGLFVADNSALPFIGAENPTLTTVALAIRTADYIARTRGR